MCRITSIHISARLIIKAIISCICLEYNIDLCYNDCMSRFNIMILCGTPMGRFQDLISYQQCGYHVFYVVSLVGLCVFPRHCVDSVGEARGVSMICM